MGRELQPRRQSIQQLVRGIVYVKDGTWYEMSEWVVEEETASERAVPVAHSIYDKIVVQSEIERRFAEQLWEREDVRLVVKLPSWFKVKTPLGTYNPDWALVMAQVDAHGNADGPLMYLVRETKGTTVADELRGSELQKIECANRHFNDTLKVNYRVITSADELP